MTWQSRAACRASPQLFDLDLDAPETPEERDARHAAAQKICAGCPVFEPCALDSLNDPTAEGIRAYVLREGIAA